MIPNIKIEDVKPCNGYCLIQPIDATESSHVVLPETGQKGRAQKGKVLAVADTNITDRGADLPISIKPGDVVLFGEYSGEDMKLDDGKEYRLIEMIFIRAIVNE